jgi:hypothetical protein
MYRASPSTLELDEIKALRGEEKLADALVALADVDQDSVGGRAAIELRSAGWSVRAPRSSAQGRCSPGSTASST